MPRLPGYLSDFSPHTWLRKYHRNSILWLVIMAFFYHALSVGLMQGGSALVSELIPDYESPSFPVSLSLAIASGPSEESLFFGIPYYFGGTVYPVLVGGIIWSFAHVFSTQTLAPNGLAYATFLATIPHLFFSLRTWISGKGWFAILFHSAWNVTFVMSYCSTGILSCSVIGPGDQMITDILSAVSASSVTLMVYVLYKKSRISSRRFRLAMILSASTFAIAQAVMTAEYVQLFFFKI